MSRVPTARLPKPAASDLHKSDNRELLVDLGLRVERPLSSVDLSFPFMASLADSLQDELFTHRAVRS